MFKKTIKFFFLALLLFLVSKVYVALNVYQSLAAFKEKHRDDFLLTYEWLSSDLNGTLSIENIEFTPYVLKRTYYIERLDITFENYLSLVSSLSGLLEGNIEAVESFSMPRIKTELKGRSLEQWFSENYSSLWFKPFDVYACGEQQNLTSAHYESMGIKELHLALNLDFSQVEASQEQTTLSMDFNELGRFQLNLNTVDGSLKQAVRKLDFSDLGIQSLSFNHQEAGFFRRLNILCNPMENKDRSVFSLLAASAWEKTMQQQGMMVNQVLVNAYREYLFRGGEMSLELSTETPFQLSTYKTLLDKELFDYFKAELRLNGQRVLNPQLYLDSQIMFPPPPKETVKAETKNETAEWTPGYRVIALENLDKFVGHKIRVLMVDQKRYEGLLNEVTEYNLDLGQNLPGGRVNYPLMLKDIQTVEVWLNNSP